MTNKKLQQLAQRFAHLAQLLSAQAETADEAERFNLMLAEIMALTPAEETIVQGMALSGLGEIGDGDTVRWLAEELEVEATLQQMPNAAGHDRACLLFALPVVLEATDSVASYADIMMLPEIHEVLEEADVVDQSASFGIVSRLFSYTELFSKSYGQLKRLNRHLAQQVLNGEQILMLPDEDFDGDGLLDGASCNPLVSLYFVVGLAITRNSDLENIFPPLAMEEEPGGPDGGFEREEAFQMTHDGNAVKYDVPESGLTLDGKSWEHAFCYAFDRAFGAIEGAVAVLPPDGIAEDLRRGLELAREIGTTRMFEDAVEEEGRDQWVRLSFLQESEGECWFDVSCLAAPEVEALDTVRWPVLNHESEAECLEKLLECLEDTGIRHESPPAERNQLGSMLLH